MGTVSAKGTAIEVSDKASDGTVSLLQERREVPATKQQVVNPKKEANDQKKVCFSMFYLHLNEEKVQSDQ